MNVEKASQHLAGACQGQGLHPARKHPTAPHKRLCSEPGMPLALGQDFFAGLFSRTKLIPMPTLHWRIEFSLRMP